MTLGDLDDVELVLELIRGAWSWRHVVVLLIFFMQAGAVGFLKPLLVGTKRHKLGLLQELVLSLSVGAEKICEDRDLPQDYCI